MKKRRAPQKSSTMVSLADLPAGGSGWIRSLELPEDARWKLMEMGFGVGRKISVIRRAPLGDPLEIGILGYRLAIRKSEARGILLGMKRT